jgi:hypothetical protein
MQVSQIATSWDEEFLSLPCKCTRVLIRHNHDKISVLVQSPNVPTHR